MASMHCPHCNAELPDERSWAEAAVSTLGLSPAIPDMATQVRCGQCGRVSAASDLRPDVADRFRLPMRVLLTALALLAAWAVYRLA